eukprot:6492665-Amphidinium_carterae.2
MDKQTTVHWNNGNELKTSKRKPRLDKPMGNAPKESSRQTDGKPESDNRRRPLPTKGGGEAIAPKKTKKGREEDAIRTHAPFSIGNGEAFESA